MSYVYSNYYSSTCYLILRLHEWYTFLLLEFAFSFVHAFSIVFEELSNNFVNKVTSFVTKLPVQCYTLLDDKIYFIIVTDLIEFFNTLYTAIISFVGNITTMYQTFGRLIVQLVYILKSSINNN